MMILGGSWKNKIELDVGSEKFRFAESLKARKALKLAEIKVDSKIPTYDCGCYIKW